MQVLADSKQEGINASRRILLVDGNEADRELAALVLSGGCPAADVLTAESPLALTKALQPAIDVLVLAARVVWCDALALVELVRQLCPSAVVVLLKAPGHDLSLALREQAKEVVTKDTAGWARLPEVITAISPTLRDVRPDSDQPLHEPVAGHQMGPGRSEPRGRPSVASSPVTTHTPEASAPLVRDDVSGEARSSATPLPPGLTVHVSEGRQLEDLIAQATEMAQQQQWEALEEPLKQALSIDGDCVAALELWVQLLRRQQRWKALVDALETLSGLSFDASQTLACIHEQAEIWADRLGDSERAAGIWRRYLEYDPFHDGVLKRLEGWYRSTGDMHRVAQLHAARARAATVRLDEEPSQAQALERVVVHARLKQAQVALHELSEPEEALRALDDALALAPREPELVACQVRALQRLGRHEKASAAARVLLPMLLPGPLHDEMRAIVTHRDTAVSATKIQSSAAVDKALVDLTQSSRRVDEQLEVATKTAQGVDQLLDANLQGLEAALDAVVSAALRVGQERGAEAEGGASSVMGDQLQKAVQCLEGVIEDTVVTALRLGRAETAPGLSTAEAPVEDGVWPTARGQSPPDLGFGRQ